VLESIVTKLRDRRAALELLKKSMKLRGRSETIKTDHLRSNGAARNDLGRVADHEIFPPAQHWAEKSSLLFRRRVRAMSRFRFLRTLQKFASVHASVHNHFPTERHLQDRNTYKQTRAAALGGGGTFS